MCARTQHSFSIPKRNKIKKDEEKRRREEKKWTTRSLTTTITPTNRNYVHKFICVCLFFSSVDTFTETLSDDLQTTDTTADMYISNAPFSAGAWMQKLDAESCLEKYRKKKQTQTYTTNMESKTSRVHYWKLMLNLFFLFRIARHFFFSSKFPCNKSTFDNRVCTTCANAQYTKWVFSTVIAAKF